MSAEPFDVIGGYAVGIPPKLVIDENGNVVNNVNAPNANVTANRVFANTYLYANGDPLSIGAAGSNTQVQYNNNGLLGASSAFTFNSATNLLTVTKLQVGSNANLGNVANVVILGGTNGYFLQTDGAGNLTWAPGGNGGNGGNGNPGGSNTQVQFNDAGNFAGDAGFTYNKTTNILTVQEINVGNVTANYVVANLDVTANVVNANFLYGDGSNITNVHANTAAVANSVAGANVTGQVNFAAVANSVAGANVTGQVAFANVANNVAGSNITGQVANALVAGTVYTSAQPNITSVGNLTSLTVIGNTTLGNQVVANYFIGNLFGLANNARTVTFSSQPNITNVGILTSLEVSGNTLLGNSTTSNYFIGNLYGVANSATLANTANLALLANVANHSNTANLAGTVSVNAQPNITSVGTLTSLNVDGISNLGLVSNITILGGTNGYVLSTDGIGNLSWVAQSGGGGNGTPGGSNTQVQFNNGGTFGASSDFTFNNTTKFLYVGANANFNGIVNATAFTSNVATGSAPFQVNSTTPVANLAVETAATVRNASQPNITSVGTLTNLNVSSTINTFDASVSNLLSITGNLSAGNFSTPGTIAGSKLIISSNANLNGITTIGSGGNLNVSGNLNANLSGNVTLGNISNLHIFGGVNGYVLTTDGAGNLSWSAGGSGGNGTPGGSNTQIQFNDAGNFGGSSFLTFDKATNNVQVAGNLIANSITVGSGIYQFSYSNVYFATTNSTNPNQVLLSIEADNGVGGNVAAVDYTIISTDGIIRNFIKISCVRMQSALNYVEYSTLPVNGYTGDFEVTFNAGNVIVSPTIQLTLSPQSANFMTHKMMVTSYYD